MKEEKVYKPCKKYVNQQFLTAFIFLAGGIFALMHGKFYFIGMSILFFIIAFMTKNRDMVKLFKTSMEMKFAPLSSTKYIRYSDIQNVEKIDDKKIFVHYKEGTSLQKIRVPVHLFEKDDLTDFLKVMRAKQLV